MSTLFACERLALLWYVLLKVGVAFRRNGEAVLLPSGVGPRLAKPSFEPTSAGLSPYLSDWLWCLRWLGLATVSMKELRCVLAMRDIRKEEKVAVQRKIRT